MTILDALTPLVFGVGASIVVNVFRWALAPAPDNSPIPVTFRVVSVRTNPPRRPTATDDYSWMNDGFVIPGVPECRPKSAARS